MVDSASFVNKNTLIADWPHFEQGGGFRIVEVRQVGRKKVLENSYVCASLWAIHPRLKHFTKPAVFCIARGRGVLDYNPTFGTARDHYFRRIVLISAICPAGGPWSLFLRAWGDWRFVGEGWQIFTPQWGRIQFLGRAGIHH